MRVRTCLIKDGYRLVTNGRGLYYLSPQPDQQAIFHVYRPGYYTGVNQDGYRKNVLAQADKQLRRSEIRLQRIQRYQSSGRLFDVGCGPGFFMRAAQRCFSVAGSDLSSEAQQFAAKHFGFEIMRKDFCALDLPTRDYNAVTMFSVLEHMPEPEQALQKAHLILKPGGLLALSLPNIECLLRYLLGKRWRGFSFPEHIHFFNRRRMEELLVGTGFTVIKPPWRENNFTRDTIYYYAQKPA